MRPIRTFDFAGLLQVATVPRQGNLAGLVWQSSRTERAVQYGVFVGTKMHDACQHESGAIG